MNLSPNLLGLITGAVMILLSWLTYQFTGDFESPWRYSIDIVYAAGILLILLQFRKTNQGPHSFKTYFSRGFRGFVLITLCMVVFHWIFLSLNPELEEQMILNLQNDMKSNENLTQAELESGLARAREYFKPFTISSIIFGYLFRGALTTAIVSFALSEQDKKIKTAHTTH